MWWKIINDKIKDAKDTSQTKKSWSSASQGVVKICSKRRQKNSLSHQLIILVGIFVSKYLPYCLWVEKVRVLCWKCTNLVRFPKDHFTVVFSLNGNEAGGDLVLIKTTLFLLCKSIVLMLSSLSLHEKSREVCIKARLSPASLAVRGQVTKHTTVKWPIFVCLKNNYTYNYTTRPSFLFKQKKCFSWGTMG